MLIVKAQGCTETLPTWHMGLHPQASFPPSYGQPRKRVQVLKTDPDDVSAIHSFESRRSYRYWPSVSDGNIKFEVCKIRREVPLPEALSVNNVLVECTIFKRIDPQHHELVAPCSMCCNSIINQTFAAHERT